MICRVYYRSDGTVAVVHPAPGARRKDESDADFMERVAEKAVAGTELEGLPFDDKASSELPDRKDRSNWRGDKATGMRVVDFIDH